jgi:hypothetical protein
LYLVLVHDLRSPDQDFPGWVDHQYPLSRNNLAERGRELSTDWFLVYIVSVLRGITRTLPSSPLDKKKKKKIDLRITVKDKSDVTKIDVFFLFLNEKVFFFNHKSF